MEFNYKRFKEKAEILRSNELLVKKDTQYKKEFQREVFSMKRFVEKIFLPELELLKNEINDRGLDYVLETYQGIKPIVNKLLSIDKEALRWMTKIS